MEVFGFLGDRGSFKTCKMTASLWHDVQAGESVTANYHLNFPHRYRTFDQIRAELKRMESDPDYRPSFAGNVVALDELSTGADSYEFMLSGNKEITKLVSQLRKADCLLYYTDQRWGKVTKRIRDQTDAFYLMRDLDKGKMTYPDGRQARRHFDVCDGVAKYIIVNSDLERISREHTFDGKPWYRYYNTREFVHDRQNSGVTN